MHRLLGLQFSTGGGVFQIVRGGTFAFTIGPARTGVWFSHARRDIPDRVGIPMTLHTWHLFRRLEANFITTPGPGYRRRWRAERRIAFQRELEAARRSNDNLSSAPTRTQPPLSRAGEGRKENR